MINRLKKRKAKIKNTVRINLIIPIIAALIGATATLIATRLTIVSTQKMQIEFGNKQVKSLEGMIQGLTETFDSLKQETRFQENNAGTEYIKMVGANGWTDTGINIKIGQRVEITAYGSWGIWDEHPEIWPLVGPEGYLNELQIISTKSHWSYDYIHSLLPLPEAIIGSLIGRIGNSGPVHVGGSKQFIAGNSGSLYLGCNDWDMNNVGAVIAQITIK
jgi:hypothetical protein